MKILDLFSGAGGLTEGFRNSHFDIICHIEMDLDACYSLKTREAFHYLKQNNNLEIYNKYLSREITREKLYELVPNEAINRVQNFEINEDTLDSIFNIVDRKLNNESLDGIIGGPPCQAYSTIGRAQNKQKKENDSRIYLYEYYLEFLKKYSPRFFVFENVKGLLSFKDSKDELLFPKIIKAFSKANYNLEFKVINSQYFGVSQKRERLFIIGTRKDLHLQENFFDILENLKEDPPSLFELFEDLPKLKSGMNSSEYLKKPSLEYIKKHIRKYKEFPLTYHIARPHNSNDLSIYKLVAFEKQYGRNVHYFDIPAELQTHKNKKSFIDRFKALDGNSISHTIVAHIAKDGHYYIHPDVTQNRSISVREAARIQSFPDDYYFESSRTAAFKQIGNAVPPVLSKKIAFSILQIIKETADN